MGQRFDTITFLSDLGRVDETVGAVHCVVRDVAAGAVVIDLTHDVAAYDVRAGSLALARAVSALPAGVVLASVDHGLGSARRNLAIEVAGGDGVFVGPDNGLLAPAVAMAGGAERAVELSNAEFHLPSPGAILPVRDVLAPVAAHICNGVDIAELGREVDPITILPATVPLPRDDGDSIIADVVWVDRFGNCQLNVGAEEIAQFGDHVRVSVGQLTGSPTVRVARRNVGLDAAGPGVLGLLDDPYGMVMLCLLRRSAAEELQLIPSDPVVLGPAEGPGADAAAPVTSPVNLRIQR